MQNQKVLEKLGYSTKEAKVYLASLAMGEAHVSDIAEKVKMPRSSVQSILEQLHEKGAMNFYVMRRYKYWVAENPNQLLERLKRREVLMEEALPSLVAIRKKAKQQNQIAKKQEDVGPMRDVANSMMQPVLIANADAEIQFVNKAWEHLFGYTNEEMYGCETRILKSGHTPPGEYEKLWKQLRNKGLFSSDLVIDKKMSGEFFKLTTIIFFVTHGNRTFYVQILEERVPENGQIEEMKQMFMTATKVS